MPANSDLRALARQTGRELAVRLRDLRATVTDQGTLTRDVANSLQEALERLAETGCVGEPNRLPSSEFWREAEAELRAGSLQLHAREKPLGYPGDHRLLDRICRHDLQGEGIGLAFDTFFQNQSAPRAVRNRGQETATTIRRILGERPHQLVRLTSVGSGPAWDIRWGLEGLTAADRQRVVVTLVDLDPRAGDFCQSQLGHLVPAPHLQWERANLKRLPRLQPLLGRLAGSDLLFCAGFFDYLIAEEATRMLQALWTCVAPRGELLVFNFSTHNPSRAYMEWIGNWYLQYRTAQQMSDLAAAAHLCDGLAEVGSEQEGVNLFLRICRHAS